MRGTVSRVLRKFHVLQFDLLVVTRETYPEVGQVGPGELVVVQDGSIKKWACLLCPGGCGAFLALSLNPDRRPRWNVEWDRWLRPTLSPSVHRTEHCRCHFWLTRGSVV